MLLDFILILFLGFLSYCLYIQIIIPYQNRRKKEFEVFDRYIENLNKKAPKE